MIPAIIPGLIEAAIRALLVAGAVWAGLRALRVNNVPAQKAAWGLVLAAAVLMPFVMRWQWLPAGTAFVLPANPIERTFARLTASAPQASIQVRQAAPAYFSKTAAVPEESPVSAEPIAAADRYPAPSISNSISADPANPRRTERGVFAALGLRLLRPTTLLWLVYIGVGCTLLARMLYGLGTALQLWMNAETVSPDSLPQQLAGLAPGLRLRTSRSVSSPVTIGSGVLLPDDYCEWDAEKLRIVLAHEHSHVRQGDFYLQTLAELHAVVFWFSPLGWWLKRKLSDLSETISDRAGLREAASRSSYAQILLEFAVAPRSTLTGVAMARSSNLSQRIERLLNDSIFHQAFVSGRRRALLAVCLVPVALFAATSLIRVEAAGQSTQQPATPPDQPAIAGQSHPDQAPAPPTAPAKLAAPSAPASDAAPAEDPSTPTPPQPPEGIGAGTGIGMGQDTTVIHDNHNVNAHRHDRSYRYMRDSNGEAYAIVRSNGSSKDTNMSFSGDWFEGRHEEIEKARKMAHGDFLWFTRQGKAYVLDDPAVVANIEAMYKPMEALGKQQEELGRKQEALGKLQEQLGRQQERASIPTPDMTREIAEIEAAMATLKAKQGKTMTTEEWADIESKIGNLQGKLGSIQGMIGSRQGEFGAKMGEMGSQQGELGAQQGRLGAEQGRIAMEADRKVKSIIDESLKNGRAKPVQ